MEKCKEKWDGSAGGDISGQEKKDLTVPELREMFARASGDEFSGDRAILA